MPVHRVKYATNEAGYALEQAIKPIEQAGEQVVQVIKWVNEWIVITAPAPAPQFRPNVTTGPWQERVA